MLWCYVCTSHLSPSWGRWVPGPGSFCWALLTPEKCFSAWSRRSSIWISRGLVHLAFHLLRHGKVCTLLDRQVIVGVSRTVLPSTSFHQGEELRGYSKSQWCLISIESQQFKDWERFFFKEYLLKTVPVCVILIQGWSQKEVNDTPVSH